MASTKKSRELAKALRQVPYDVGMEHGIRIGRAEGLAEARAEVFTEAAKKMMDKGMSDQDIHEILDLPMETIEEIRKQVK